MTEKEKPRRFAMVFSGGKDSAIAMNRMIQKGHTPVCLVVGTDTRGLSHMHHLRPSLVRKYGDALGLSVVRVPMEQKYDFDAWLKAFEKLVATYAAQAVCTGDIAFPYSRENMMKMAQSFGMEAFSPLWGIGEEELIEEIRGIEIIIKSLANRLELNDLLGKRLDDAAIDRLHERGLRLSEDTSELHTLAVNGPIFRRPLQYRLGEVIRVGQYSLIDIHSVS